MGDFNADLLKYEDGTVTASFLNQICATSLLRQITLPFQIATSQPNRDKKKEKRKKHFKP